MAIIHQPREAPLGLRQLIFPALFVVVFGLLLLRLWYLQVVRYEELSMLAVSSGEVRVERIAPRGLIEDRHGTPLAWLESELVVMAKPSEALEHPEAIVAVASLLGADVEKLRSEIEEGLWRRHLYQPVYVGATIEAATKIAESEDEFPGFRVETQPMRRYRDTEVLAHVLGYVWTPNDRDVERLEAQGIEPAEYVGKDGIERQYEYELMGRAGAERLRVDARGRPLQSLGLDAPVPGYRLNMALDFDLQRLAMQQLQDRRGAVVMLNPNTGHVYCLASAPTFDAGLFIGGIGTEDYQTLVNDPDKPLFRRAIAGGYAPGSTFKIVTTLAASMSGKWTPTDRVTCRGYYRAGNRNFGCLGVHGSVAFEEAFAESCNTYFAEMGVRAGKENLWAATQAVGIGERTGIDLPGESAGKYLSQELIDMREDKRWYPGDSVNYSIGQGELLTTPLQMACIATLVANRGVNYQPRLVQSYEKSNGETVSVQGEVLARVNVPDRVWSELRNAMIAATKYGTVNMFQIKGMEYGAKTGSAENAASDEAHSWIVGFAPAENPQVAFAVLAENSGHGSEVAAPIAEAMLRAFFTGRDERIEVQAEPNRSEESSRTSSASDENPLDE